MSVLIIGGRGLIGIHTARHFLREGYTVVIYDPFCGDTGDFFAGLPAPVQVEGDVNDLDRLLCVIDEYKIHGAVHAAITYGGVDAHEDASGSFKDIVEGTQRLLEAARRTELRLVCVSTQAVYGARPDLQPVREDEVLNPNNVYACWKAMCDLMCLTYNRIYQVDLVVIRTSFVYGPHRRKRRHLADVWLRKALAGEPVEMPDGADHVLDWTYAEDVAQGIFRAYSVRPLTDRLFNISQGKIITLQELAKTIMDLVPGSEIKLGAGLSEYLTKHVAAQHGPGDITRAREQLGYSPQYTIQKGVAELLDWIRSKEPKLLRG